LKPREDEKHLTENQAESMTAGEKAISLLTRYAIRRKRVHNLQHLIGSEHIGQPQYALLDRAGNMHVSDWETRKLFTFDPQWQLTEVVQLPDGCRPISFVFDQDNNLYVAHYSARRIYRRDAGSKDIVRIWEGESEPVQVLMEENKLWLSLLDGRILIISTDGEVLEAYGQDHPNYPMAQTLRGIVLDKEGILYMCDTEANTILRFDTRNPENKLSPIGSESITKPVYVALDDNGNLFVTQLHISKLVRFRRDGELLFNLNLPEDWIPNSVSTADSTAYLPIGMGQRILELSIYLESDFI
jgi:sugar lactone lactonase YvrE